MENLIKFEKKNECEIQKINNNEYDNSVLQTREEFYLCDNETEKKYKKLMEDMEKYILEIKNYRKKNSKCVRK